jgi:hypothetical protein
MKNLLASLPFAAVALVLALSAPGLVPARAQEPPKELGKFGDWDALSYKDNGGMVCYAATLPKKQDGHKGAEGETILQVTDWPAKKRLGVVSLSVDYTYKKGADVELEIGKTRLKLNPVGRAAWASQEGDDAKIIRAMKSANELVLRATTDQGKAASDGYSLRGFSKALDTAHKACGVKG